MSIDPSGVAEHLADIQPLLGGEYLVVPHRDEHWLNSRKGLGLFDDLPYFLDDLRPQGFLGRALAKTLGSPYPEDPRLWTATQILSWLVTYGIDLPGDLILGEQALARSRDLVRRKGETDLSRLAEAALAGDVAGSSIGGEQPKFLIADGTTQQLIKFSGRGDSPEVSRWRDLLIAEHHALSLLALEGIPAADSSLVAADGRTFLVLRRFDREGAQGRRPMLSLRAVDAEYAGVANNWSASMRRLAELGLVSPLDAERAAWLQLFGHWIGNNDMHLGNLSLEPTANGFNLLPIYDMTSMLFAPIRGELPTPDGLRPPIRDPRLESLWASSARVAQVFWHRLQEEPRLSKNFRGIATECAALINTYQG